MIDTTRQLASDKTNITQTLTRRDLRHELEKQIEDRGNVFWYPRFETDIRMSGGGFGVFAQKTKNMRKNIMKGIKTALAPINFRIERYLNPTTKENASRSHISRTTAPQETLKEEKASHDLRQSTLEMGEKDNSEKRDEKTEDKLPE